jgi:enterochelin esterase-like enzyme
MFRMTINRRSLTVLFCWVFALALAASAQVAPRATRFEVTFPGAAHTGPITGRVFVIISRTSSPEPRYQIGTWFEETPFFGTDISQLKPGEPAVIDSGILGYPLRSLREIPAGDYYVQALVDVYTEFHRADGHTIWAHMDQWEGQQFNVSPGNLYSGVERVHLDPALGYTVRLKAENVIPPVQPPSDTDSVKHIKIQSKLLTAFWGRPMYIGAVVALPSGYDQHPDLHYPVIYDQGHFGLRGPRIPSVSGVAPRMIAVTFQHPTPYFDDSYAVNSANNGPYGDAIMQELVPYVEEHFRIIRQPWARVLTGGSTGGWESLALLLSHPEFFGATWAFFPDPVDFRHYQLTDIYSDDNAFYAPGFEWVRRERPMMRTEDGQVIETTRQMSQLEQVLGTHGRSGQQFEAWEAVYGPVGDDGYPKPLWDKLTGKIDHGVAAYMRANGYDLRYYAEKNWSRIGPLLVDKIHIYCGDMDNYYLNVSVNDMEEFLNSTTNPAAQATFQYGRPFKGHGWTPFSSATLDEAISEFITAHAPAGADVKGWKY